MFATQIDASSRLVREGDTRVFVGFNRCRALAAVALGTALAGCAVDDTSQGWFAKPLDVFGARNGGYTYSELQESKRQRPIGANELVDGNGGCPAPAASPRPPTVPGAPAATPGAPAEPASLLGGGIGLGMSECEVVYRAGQPNAVKIGQNPNGDRTALLSYNSGPRPGVYHFERGALTQMDRVQEPPAQPQATKKKAAKSNKPPKKDDQS
jgi:hypothetical protein